ncbi:HTH domain-containing protein [Haloferax sp. DFSO60]|uniref:HTH domain-containing protein n=1 Tax=Haloferax sp. DFSO60 TaxID=3388652 RepID=UPI00397ABA5B
MSDERPRQTRPSLRIQLWILDGEHSEFEPVLNTLDEYVHRGLIDHYSVETWSRFVDLSGNLSYREQRIREHLDAYARWAVMHGKPLSGLGDLVVRGVGRMGPERMTRRVPRAVMAEYEDGVLTTVTACEEGVGTLHDRLCELDDECTRREASTTLSVES